MHVFRTSFPSWRVENGERRIEQLVEAALAHVVTGVKGAYVRSDLFERRRRLMQAWADYLGCSRAGRRKLQPAPSTPALPLKFLHESNGLTAETDRALMTQHLCGPYASATGVPTTSENHMEVPDKENSRSILLRRDVEHRVLKPLRAYGWSATVESSTDPVNIVEIAIDTGSVTTRIAVLYGGRAISNEEYISLSKRVGHIFVRGQPHTLNSRAKGVEIPIDPLDDFYPFLISLNNQEKPDRSESALVPRKTRGMKRQTAENPIDTIFARLEHSPVSI